MIISSKLHNRQRFFQTNHTQRPLELQLTFQYFHRDEHLSVNTIFVIIILNLWLLEKLRF